MLRDYRPNKKNKPEEQPQQKKSKPNQKILFSISLVLIVIFLLGLAVKFEWRNFYKLKANERVLLIKDQRPMAILFFNVSDKQLIVTDLSESKFDLSALETEATLSGNIKKNLIYAFLFYTSFDQNYEYPYNDLSQTNLLSFFKNQKKYYFFLQDHELLWREKSLTKDSLYMQQPMFNCPVALVNTTTETGLANSLSTILENSAFSIIKKDSNADNLSQTKIIYNQEEATCGEVLTKLSKILPESLIVADQKEASKHRAALVIYIGRDLADLYVFFVNLFHGQI